MMKQRIDQRVLPVTSARMYDQTGRFVQDEEIIVFKKKRRHNYRRKKGHRQQQTVLRITEISGASGSQPGLGAADGT